MSFSQYFDNIFDPSTRKGLLERSLTQTVNQKVDFEVESNINIPYLNKLINYYDITNQLQSRFLEIGQISQSTPDHGSEYQVSNTFVPAPFNLPSIWVARVLANNTIQTTTNMAGLIIPVMDEYRNLQLPFFNASDPDPYASIVWRMPKGDVVPERINTNFATPEARVLNKSQINPTNIYYTKLSFRDLIQKRSLVHVNIQEFVIIDFPLPDVTISLMIAVEANGDGTLVITPEGEQYVKRTLLEQQINAGIVNKTSSVINHDTIISDILGKIPTESGRESFLAELADKTQDLKNVYLKKDIKDKVVFNEVLNNQDTILKAEEIKRKEDDAVKSSKKKPIEERTKILINKDIAAKILSNEEIADKYNASIAQINGMVGWARKQDDKIH
jgi:hypothetical protein